MKRMCAADIADGRPNGGWTREQAVRMASCRAGDAFVKPAPEDGGVLPERNCLRRPGRSSSSPTRLSRGGSKRGPHPDGTGPGSSYGGSGYLVTATARAANERGCRHRSQSEHPGRGGPVTPSAPRGPHDVGSTSWLDGEEAPAASFSAHASLAEIAPNGAGCHVKH